MDALLSRLESYECDTGAFLRAKMGSMFYKVTRVQVGPRQ
jgi:hypothetical protein